jgi:hypothetical protein
MKKRITAEQWNERYPVGTRVKYTPLKYTGLPVRESVTMAPARKMEDIGWNVVTIEGGEAPLSSLTVIEEGDKE